MKVKIKSFNGVLEEYLTLDKLYLVQEILDDNLFSINADNNVTITIYTKYCFFLNGRSWEVVNEWSCL